MNKQRKNTVFQGTDAKDANPISSKKTMLLMK